MMDSIFNPAAIEPRVATAWDDARAFAAGCADRQGAAPFCMVIPPPNVTGNLHMGHALNNTLQDILCRFERMRGKDVLWQPGTDHAGIATQMVVERQLAQRGEPDRPALGRAAFVEKIWAWKAESGGAIVHQLKRLGASCDWSRERFTMDEGLSEAVRQTFVRLSREGLIYKDKRLVNWDPKLQTAISDLEVLSVEVKGAFKWRVEGEVPFDSAALNKVLAREPGGHMVEIAYPLEGTAFDPADPTTFLRVATTRPETLLGDTAVAVHPENEALRHLIGRHLILPLVGRRIPIVGDSYADPDKGTGAVKITPAHDFNDFEVSKRHALPAITILDKQGRISLKYSEETLDIPQALEDSLHGVDRFVARAQIIDALHAGGFLRGIEPCVQTIPHGDRSNVPIEPLLTEQWYVDAATLAGPALAAVRDGRTQFIPKNWEKTVFDWLENIQPWCISRQLWWGHQIPAWYGPIYENGQLKEGPSDKKIFVGLTEEEILVEAKEYYKSTGLPVEIVPHDVPYNKKYKSQSNPQSERPEPSRIPIWRDEDVLDTWFSSALWPFSTLGWPDKTPELARFYPTNTLITGFDIIFFWVARMMMMGLHLTGEVPFKDVYIHALVRDASGAKMSKSKGNVIDPLGIMDEYGADALRFTLALMAAQGRDIKLAGNRVETARNFATKLWNAARFAEMNHCTRVDGFDPTKVHETLNRWILSETARTAQEVTGALEQFRFNEAAQSLWRFVWNIFCDWCLELSKPVLQGEASPAQAETRATIAFVLDESLKLLHPFMPFITEELWAIKGAQGPARSNVLALAAWPALAALQDAQAEAAIGLIIDLVSSVRSVRNESRVPESTAIDLVVIDADAPARAMVEAAMAQIRRLLKMNSLTFAAVSPPQSAQILVRGLTIALPLEGIIDLAAERARLQKDHASQISEIDKINARLANPKFMAGASEDVLEDNRTRLDEAHARAAHLEAALARLGSENRV
jgi:valyl-tRNA synthetase